MKKIILVVMLLLVGISGFSKKYQPNNKSLEIFLEENFGEQYVGYAWSDSAQDKYGFRISGNNKDIYLFQIYDENSRNTGGELVKTDVYGGSVTEGKYRVFRHSVKGVYYVKDYVDSKGVKHSRLYFGFDEQNGTIVILDGNMNIIEVLNPVAVG